MFYGWWIVGACILIMAYTGGVVFYAWRKLPFNHAIWHVFVLAGSLCHFFAVLLFVIPDAKI